MLSFSDFFRTGVPRPDLCGDPDICAEVGINNLLLYNAHLFLCDDPDLGDDPDLARVGL